MRRHAARVLALHDDGVERGEHAGFGLVDQRTRTRDAALRFGEFGAARFGAAQRFFLRADAPVRRCGEHGQRFGRGRELEVVAELGQRLVALGLEVGLARGDEGAARGGHVEVVVAAHAERHAARLGLRQVGHDFGGAVRDLLLQVEALHLQVGGERVQHHFLRGGDHGFVVSLVAEFGGALRRAHGAAVDQAHARFGGEHGVVLALRVLGAAAVGARRSADLEARVARHAGRVDAEAAGVGRGLRSQHFGVLLRQRDERLLHALRIARGAEGRWRQAARQCQRGRRPLLLRRRLGIRGGRQRHADAQGRAEHTRGDARAPARQHGLAHGSRKASRRSLSTGRRMYQMNGSVPTRRSTSDSMPAVTRFSGRPTCDCDMLMSSR
ncbi:hypothetical protein FQZ97_679050 [compost metagenome]